MDAIRNTPMSELRAGARYTLSHVLTELDLTGAGSVIGTGSNDSTLPARAAALLLAHVIGVRFPGAGTRILAENFRYGAAAAAGDALSASVAVREVDTQARTALLDCQVSGRAGAMLVEGEALIRPPEAPGSVDRGSLPALRPRLPVVFPALLDRCAGQPPVPTAVAHPCDVESLLGPLEAARRGLIVPILVGPAHRIDAAAQQGGIDLTGIERIDTPHSHASAAQAVELVRLGRAEALMKGSLHTDELLAAALEAGAGLRTGRRVSHVFVMDVPAYPRPLLISDAAVNIAPDLEAKADIIRNAIDLAVAMGITAPKIAILSAVETVTGKIPSTLDAAALCKMAERGQIVGGVLDGPLAFDNAVSPIAAEVKGLHSPVAGVADILIVPDLEAGNMVAKQLSYLAGADSAGIVLGLRVPIALTSRADNAQARLASCALLALMARARHA
jgi:phosphate acetyltransferase